MHLVIGSTKDTAFTTRKASWFGYLL